MRSDMRISVRTNEGGFVLVWALLLMVVLLILGISGIDTATFQSLMSANNALHKQSFYQADGGTNVSSMLIEENVSCPVGFTGTFSATSALINGNVLVQNLVMYRNTGTLGITDLDWSGNTGQPSDAHRDAYYFYNPVDPLGNTLQRTNIRGGGDSTPTPGWGQPMAAGYDSPGKSSGKGGSSIGYDSYAQYINVRQSRNTVNIIWQHINGFEGACNY
jgi:hypothetical protein